MANGQVPTYQEWVYHTNQAAASRNSKNTDPWGRPTSLMMADPDTSYAAYKRNVLDIAPGQAVGSSSSTAAPAPTYVAPAAFTGTVQAATMDPGLKAQMDALITQATSPTNPYITALNNAALLAAQYSPEAATADAQATINSESRKQAEKNQPMLRRAAEGAGTSAGSMQALMANDFAARTAEAAATLGAQQKLGYGQIAAGINSSLVSAAAQGDPTAKLLVQLQSIGMEDIGNQRTTGTQKYLGDLGAYTDANQLALNKYLGDLQASTQQRGQDLGLEGTKYSADAGVSSSGISAGASTANAQTAANASMYNTDVNASLAQLRLNSEGNNGLEDPFALIKKYAPDDGSDSRYG